MNDAFLAAITAAPDDDLPRLVYADWLDEHGDADRAEFIRTQIELAKLSPTDPRRAELATREEELLTPHKVEWGLPDFRSQSQVFRRGFVEAANVTAEWLVNHPQALDAPGPLRALRVFTASAFVGRLSEVPGLARLESLDLTNTLFGGAADVRLFFTTARLHRLTALSVRNSNWVEGEELSALADTPVARQLRALDVSGNRLSDPGVRVLASRPEFAHLEAFTYRRDGIDFHQAVHARGAGDLAESRTLTRLRVLDLGHQYIGDAGLAWLSRDTRLTGLEVLAVESNEIGELGDSGVSAVVASTDLPNLRELRLGGNRLDPPGAEALANWPHLERMTVVDLRESPLSPAVRAILAASPWADRFVM